MLYRILKKDLRRKKGVNFILFLFIMIATIFLASSVNNILVVSSAVDYYMDYANVPGISLLSSGEEEKDDIMEWFRQEPEYVDAFGYEELLTLEEKDISIKKNGKESKYDAGGDNIYLGTQESNYCKVFDEKGKSFTLKTGEIAVASSTMAKENLKEGDKIIIWADDGKKEFTIRYSVKDAAYGNEMTGMKRLIVNKADYGDAKNKKANSLIGIYYAETKNPEALSQSINEQGFSSIINTVTISTYKLLYVFDMIIAALLIMVGVCLILIALLVLRFTLVFTIEEDYREIGIMKAIGMRDFGIKRIYLIKYLAIVAVGALCGFFVSIPVSSAMVAGVSKNMIMEDGSAYIGMNIACTILVIILVLLFCYLSTRKLNKVSAITAIRNGQSGERYGRRSGLLLHKNKRLPVPVFLGINDIASHMKRYLVLMITFCISFVLITIPLNTINTMEGDEMVSKFGMDPDSSVYVKKLKDPEGKAFKNSKDLEEGMSRLRRELADKGYKAEIAAVAMYFLKCQGEEEWQNIMTTQLKGYDNEFLSYKEGTAPVLENEIAFSDQIMNEKNWKIGDRVFVNVNGQEKEFVITGTYTDYIQIGKSARMNTEIDLSNTEMFENWATMVYLDTNKTQEELVKEMDKKLPKYEWTDAQERVNSSIGEVKKAMSGMRLPMTVLLTAVIMLITLLMEKLFIVREKGEVAMMKSVGFLNRSIRGWQLVRMACVVAVSMIVAIPLSLLSNRWILKPIFFIMGAEMDIKVIPWQVYGVYPGILFAGILAATFWATRGVKRIHIQELNNLE